MPEFQAQSPDEALRRAKACLYFSKRRGFFSDLLSVIKEARAYRLWQKILTALRRVRLISLFLHIFGWVSTLLQTGTLVILTTVLLFLILPIFLVFLICLAATALIDSRRSIRRLSEHLKDKQVYVFFCANGNFGIQNACALASDPHIAVLTISPYWIGAKGLLSNKRYVNMRQDGERLFLIRRYFYFAVRKRILKNGRTTLVY